MTSPTHLTPASLTSRSLAPHHLTLPTAYPGQVGIHPIPLNWGAPTATERGPVVASRQTKSIKIRNAIGAVSAHCHSRRLSRKRCKIGRLGGASADTGCWDSQHGGTYSVYRALATASGLIDPNHRPGMCSSRSSASACPARGPLTRTDPGVSMYRLHQHASSRLDPLQRSLV